jgi:hypothetical protein
VRRVAWRVIWVGLFHCFSASVDLPFLSLAANGTELYPETDARLPVRFSTNLAPSFPRRGAVLSGSTEMMMRNGLALPRQAAFPTNGASTSPRSRHAPALHI